MKKVGLTLQLFSFLMALVSYYNVFSFIFGRFLITLREKEVKMWR